jgi:predicted secreted Zn-dependent protease
MTQKTADEIRELHSDAKVDFELVENSAFNDSLLRSYFFAAHLQRIFAQQNDGRVMSLKKICK